MGKKSLIALYVILAIFTLVILCTNVFGATISGDVYDDDFRKISRALITIDSEPEQKMLSEDGTYSFSIFPGDYTITAEYSSDFSEYEAEESVVIKKDGDFTIDLFLFPTIKEEEQIIKEVEDFSEQFIETEFNFVALAVIVLWLVVMFIIIKFFIEKNKKEHSEESDLKPYIEYIKKQKRTTQKDIRREFPLSEAKISLIIAELEKKGIVDKIKKGRGNIVIYKGKR